MTLNEAIKSFINANKTRNSLFSDCGFFGLCVNDVIRLTNRKERTLYNWSKSDRDMLLIVLIGCRKLSKK